MRLDADILEAQPPTHFASISCPTPVPEYGKGGSSEEPLLMKVMIWNAARGGMRSVVTSYIDAGFVAENDICLIHSYGDATFAGRQILLLRAIAQFSCLLATRRIELVH